LLEVPYIIVVSKEGGEMAHSEHKLVPLSEAADACGRPYQYIFGMWRAARTNKASYGRQARTDTVIKPGGKMQKVICVHCVTDYYGKAVEDVSDDADVVAIDTRFVGFRGWEISNDGTRLVSSRHFIWDPNGAEAICPRHRKAPCPDSGGRRQAQCFCGIYAASEHWSQHIFGRVRGAVGLWGRFVEAEAGFRAQFGKPLALLCNGNQLADSIHRLCTIYRIAAVHNYDGLEEVKRNADREDPQDWSSDALAAAKAAERAHPGRAACRVAAARARDLDELKNLARGGLISPTITLADMIDKRY
jgi:hypothetical protein